MIGFVNAHQASMLGWQGQCQSNERAEGSGRAAGAQDGAREKRRKVERGQGGGGGGGGGGGVVGDDEPGGAAGGAAEHLGAASALEPARTRPLVVRSSYKNVGRSSLQVGGERWLSGKVEERKVVEQYSA